MKSSQKPAAGNTRPLWSAIKSALIPAAIPLLLTIIAFLPTLHDSFTNWDDDVYVTKNSLIQSLLAENILRIFSPHSLVCGNYQPVTILSLAVNFAFGHFDPHGYIVTNILLQVMNVLLVFLLIRLISGSDLIAAFAAALFGFHPMHVESVAWVTGRKDLLYVLFYLSAMICYWLHLQPGSHKNRRYWYWSAAVLSLLSILSKSSAVTLPAAFLLLDYFKGRKFSAGMIWDKLVFLAICLPPGIYSIVAQKNDNLLDPGFSVPAANLPFIGIASYAFYVTKFFLPIHLSAYYPYPVSHIPGHAYIMPIAFVIATAASLYVFRKQKPFIFGLSFFLLNVIFILHFVPVGRTMIADRFSYLAYIGPAYMLGHYLLRLFHSRAGAKNGPLIFTMVGVLISATACYASHSRCAVWKDSLSLWSDVVRRYPDPVSLTNLGNALLDGGKTSQALAGYTRALEIDPKFVRAYYNRGLAYSKTGASDKALAEFSAAVSIVPEYVDAWVALGSEYETAGKLIPAVECFSKAISLSRTYALAYVGRGMVFQKMGNNDRALEDFSTALALAPDLSEARAARGTLLSQKGDIAAAARDLDQAVAQDNSNESALCSRGLLYNGRGMPDSAIILLTRALSLNPRSASAYTGRGISYGMKGQLVQAEADLDSSIKLNPADAKAWFNRGLVFMSGKKPDAAIADMTKALALDPSFIQAYNNRGALYAMQQRWALALADFNAAIKLNPGDASLVANRDYVIKMMK